MAEEKRTLIGMLAGIVIYGIAAGVAAGFLVQDKGPFIAGIILGCAVGGGLAVHMLWGLDRTLLLNEEYAARYARKLTAIRMLLMLAAIAVAALLPEIFHVLAAVIGLFGLKVSAYLQPFMDKLIFRKGR